MKIYQWGNKFRICDLDLDLDIIISKKKARELRNQLNSEELCD